MTNRLQSSGIAALSFTVSAGLLALALTPATAKAAASDMEPYELVATGERMVESRTIDASDVDFTNAADVKRLGSRINQAINQVCRDGSTGRTLIASGRCYSDARQSANQQIAVLRSSATTLAAVSSVSGVRRLSVVASR